MVERSLQQQQAQAAYSPPTYGTSPGPIYNPPPPGQSQPAPPVWDRSASDAAYNAQRQAERQAGHQPSSVAAWPTALALLILAAAGYFYFSASSSYSGWWLPLVSAALVTLDVVWFIYGVVTFVRGIDRDGGQAVSGIIIITSATVAPYLMFIAGALNIASRLNR